MVWGVIVSIWAASLGVIADGLPEKLWREKPDVERTHERAGRWTVEETPEGREVCYHPANERYEPQCIEAEPAG